MCGRYAFFHGARELGELFGPLFEAHAQALPQAFDDPWEPRYNIAPTQEVLVLHRTTGTPRLQRARWGLVPHWVRDPAEFRATLFNARAETAAEKPSFRDAFARGRCLLPASGFYEWRQAGNGGGKTPHFIRLRGGAPLAFAGLYARWRKGDRELHSCAILTTRPNELMAELHDRMPVIVAPEAFARWLEPEIQQPEALADLLGPYPAEAMEAYPVGRAVGNPRNDGPELIAPAG